MDPMAEEQLDYGDDRFGGVAAPVGGGAIHALADEGIDDDFDDLYNDVNVGENFMRSVPHTPNPPIPEPAFANGSTLLPPPNQKVESSPRPQPTFSTPVVRADSNPNPRVQQDLGFRPAMPPPPTRAPPLNPVAPPLPPSGPVDASGPTMLFVGELHWWTTDAEIESVLSQYGRVKEIKFFDERASGKSKGYCQVEFYDAAAAAACKEGMDGYQFNGRVCVVAFASPQTLRQMGASFVNRNQGQGQSQQGRRQMNDGMGRGGGGGSGGGGDGGGRGFNRGGGGGRGGQGMMNRGQGSGGGMRGRGFNGGRGGIGAGGGGVGTGGPFGQGIVAQGPLGGPVGGLMHPQGMIGAGFDPTYMGRGGPYGGFGAPAFTGMMPSFPAMNAVGLQGVAPHVNPAFFARGMTTNGMGGMGMMGGGGMDGQMWGDAGMGGGGWTGEENTRKTRESSYGDDDSEYGHGNDRGGRSNFSREKERGPEREWSGNSERRLRDEKEQDWERSDRERYREEKDGYRDYRSRDRDYDNNEDDWDRGQSTSRSRSRMVQEDDHRSRSRDADYGKRRCMPSE